MMVLTSSTLDNCICELAHKLGYTHILYDGVTYKIVIHEDGLGDWELDKTALM